MSTSATSTTPSMVCYKTIGHVYDNLYYDYSAGCYKTKTPATPVSSAMSSALVPAGNHPLSLTAGSPTAGETTTVIGQQFLDSNTVYKNIFNEYKSKALAYQKRSPKTFITQEINESQIERICDIAIKAFGQANPNCQFFEPPSLPNLPQLLFFNQSKARRVYFEVFNKPLDQGGTRQFTPAFGIEIPENKDSPPKALWAASLKPLMAPPIGKIPLRDHLNEVGNLRFLARTPFSGFFPVLYNSYSDDKTFRVMQELGDDSLVEFIKGAEHKTPQDICYLVWDLLKQLEGLHSNGMVHADIKQGNILIKNGTAADGQNRRHLLLADLDAINSNRSTFLTLAPERVKKAIAGNRGICDMAGDIWAMGQVIISLANATITHPRWSPLFNSLDLITTYVYKTGNKKQSVGDFDNGDKKSVVAGLADKGDKKDSKKVGPEKSFSEQIDEWCKKIWKVSPKDFAVLGKTESTAYYDSIHLNNFLYSLKDREFSLADTNSLLKLASYICKKLERNDKKLQGVWGQLEVIVEKRVPDVVSDTPQEAMVQEIARKMLHLDPAKRMTAKALIETYGDKLRAFGLIKS